MVTLQIFFARWEMQGWLQQSEQRRRLVARLDLVHVRLSLVTHACSLLTERFQYSQIDAVIQKLRETGSRVLLVLHPKWLRADADRTVTKRKKRKLEPWPSFSSL